MKRSFSVYIIGRVLIGLFFIVVGGEKLLSPYQNFLYVIENYEIFPSFIEKLAARTVPWIEVLLGVFLVVGLWMRWALRSFLVLTGIFIIIVGQALVRKLPIVECGCFGGLISFSLPVTFGIDIVLFLSFWIMLRNADKTSLFGLDAYYLSSKR